MSYIGQECKHESHECYIYVQGQLVIPAELRRKYGIEAGTKVKILEDQFGRIVLQPITEDHIDRLMGCLAKGPDLKANWEKEHHAEGKHDR